MNITFCAATIFEIQPLIDHLRATYIEHKPWQFTKDEKEVHVLITGVGSYATMHSFTKYLQYNKPKLCIQAGIAGAFNTKLKIGDVVQVTEDRIVDLGAETADRNFIDIFEMGFVNPDQPPFSKGILSPLEKVNPFLPLVKSISSNTVSGYKETIDHKIDKYNADIESMEGAAFAYVCHLEKKASVQIRSISNYVTPRDTSKWDIPAAIESLNKVLLEMLAIL